MLVLFFLYLSSQQITDQTPQEISSNAKISDVDFFIKQLDTQLLPTVVTMATTSVLHQLPVLVVASNQYIPPNETTLVSFAIFNGTYRGLFVSPHSIVNLTSRLQSSVQTNLYYNVSISARNLMVTLNQTSPWFLTVSAFFVYNVTDRLLTVQNVTKLIQVNVSIRGLRDPLLYYNTPGTDFLSTYDVSITDTNTTKGTWDIQKLLTHINRSTYMYDPSAPSYLDRLWNQTTPSVNGISSVLNPHRVKSAINLTKSFVDYQYFQDWNCSATTESRLYNITGISRNLTLFTFAPPSSPQFKLSENYTLLYLNATEYTTTGRVVSCP
jgi:hypothetical protein